jgi:hypothetical protein
MHIDERRRVGLVLCLYGGGLVESKRDGGVKPRRSLSDFRDLAASERLSTDFKIPR